MRIDNKALPKFGYLRYMLNLKLATHLTNRNQDLRN